MSKATPDPNGGYDINTVQPPDEYHTGVNNSAYTNAAAATALQDAVKAAQVVGQPADANWTTVATGLTQTMPFVEPQHLTTSTTATTACRSSRPTWSCSPIRSTSRWVRRRRSDDLNYYAPRTDLQGPAMTDAIHSIDASALNAPGCSAYTYMLRSYEPFLRRPPTTSSPKPEPGRTPASTS